MAKLKLPFELEKPSANEYVTETSEIGHNGRPLEEVLDEDNSVFDVSKRNAVGGVYATYSSLADLLTNHLADIPVNNRVGGMSIKFIETASNKYVQYRLSLASYENTTSGNNAFKDVANWQGIDDMPTYDSDNAVKSGGVAKVFAKVGNEIDCIDLILVRPLKLEWKYGSYSTTTGEVVESLKTATVNRMLYLPAGTTILVGSGYKVAVLGYEKSGAFTGVISSFYAGNISISTSTYCRIFIRKTDNSNFSESEVKQGFDSVLGFSYTEDINKIISDVNKDPIFIDEIAPSLSASGLTQVGKIFYNTTNNEFRKVISAYKTSLYEVKDGSLIICHSTLYKYIGGLLYSFDEFETIVDIASSANNSFAKIGELYWDTTTKKVCRKTTATLSAPQYSDKHFYLLDGSIYIVKEDSLVPLTGKHLIESNKDVAIDVDDLIMGSFGTDGRFYPNNTYTCHTDFLIHNCDMVVLCSDNNITMRAAYFNDDETYIDNSMTAGWVIKSQPIRANMKFIVLFRYADSRAITSTEIEYIKTHISFKRLDSVAPINNMGYWIAPKVPSITDIPTYSDFIGLYSTLISENPAYASMETVMKDTSGTYDIYKIVLTPKAFKRTIMVVSGVHGDETEGYWSLYRFVELLCNHYLEYPELLKLREDVRFVIIPVVNPYGVQNSQRKNSRDLDPNWNFSVFWGVQGYSYEGSAPFSENEALAIKTVFEQYDDIAYYSDWHTDPYDGLTNFIEGMSIAPNRKLAETLIDEENARIALLSSITKTSVYTPTVRSSSFAWAQLVKGVPANIVEFSPMVVSPTQLSSKDLTWALQWYVNVLMRMNDWLDSVNLVSAKQYIIADDKECFAKAVRDNIETDKLECYQNSASTKVTNLSDDKIITAKFNISSVGDICQIGDTLITTIANGDGFSVKIGTSTITSNFFMFNRDVILMMVEGTNNIKIYINETENRTISRVFGTVQEVVAINVISLSCYSGNTLEDRIFYTYKR